MVGAHSLKCWSRTQSLVALSSGESELYSSVCGLTRFFGLVNVLREMRGETWGGPLEHGVDAAACKSTLLRRGLGGVKHIETKTLWVQEAIQR